jgi:hypothetical protein
MQRYKDKKVIINNKIVKRHVYFTDNIDALPATVIRISKRWHEVHKGIQSKDFEYVAGRELTYIEQRILEEYIEEFKTYGEV